MNLSRLFTYIAGPELYWALVCLAMHGLGRRNSPPTEAGSRALEAFWYWLPFAFVPIVFLVFAMPGAGRWWLLLRINIATLVGLFFAAAIITGAIDYRDSRNSGTLAGFIIAVVFGCLILGAGSAVSAVILWWRARGKA